MILVRSSSRLVHQGFHHLIFELLEARLTRLTLFPLELFFCKITTMIKLWEFLCTCFCNNYIQIVMLCTHVTCYGIRGELFTKLFSFWLSLDIGNVDAKIEMQKGNDGKRNFIIPFPFHNNPTVSSLWFEIFWSSEKWWWRKWRKKICSFLCPSYLAQSEDFRRINKEDDIFSSMDLIFLVEVSPSSHITFFFQVFWVLEVSRDKKDGMIYVLVANHDGSKEFEGNVVNISQQEVQW